MTIGPRGHHLVSHNHKRCHDGRQKHGCQGACWAETVAHAFDVGVSKSLAIQAKQALNAWSTSMARRRSDERLWELLKRMPA